MAFANDFILPDAEKETPRLPPEKAAEEAFYTAAFTDNPIASYSQFKADLDQQGWSAAVDSVKSRLAEEDNVQTQALMEEFILDPSIPAEDKRGLMSVYAATGIPPRSLRERYIDKMASQEYGLTLEDKKSQDLVVESLASRKAALAANAHAKDIEEGWASLASVIKGTGSVASSILASIPAGHVALWNVIQGKDADQAANASSELQQVLTYTPEDQKAQAVAETIVKWAGYAGIPAEWIGDKTLELTGSPAAATTANIVLDPINWLPFGALTKPIRSITKIKPGSTLGATKTANPKAAEDLAALAIRDETGQVAEALGNDRGIIVADMVLPQPIPKDATDIDVDLLEKLKIIDEDAKASYEYYRYDPNVTEAVRKEQEIEMVSSILKQGDGPYYNQAKSSIVFTDKSNEGVAWFGRDSSSGYNTVEDAFDGITQLENTIKDLPEELQGVIEVEEISGQYWLKWKWAKQYDDLAGRVFGEDAVNTTVLGVDSGKLARSKLGNWLFPTSRFPEWFESGGQRASERGAAAASSLMEVLRKEIVPLKHKKELNTLITKAEEEGLEYISKAEMSTMFPKLSDAELSKLHSAHTIWRRIQHHLHAITNRNHRNFLVSKGWNKGLYDKEGKYLGAASDKVIPSEFDKISELWDMDTETAIKFHKDQVEVKDGAYSYVGRPIAKLEEYIDSNGKAYRHVLLGKSHKLEILPTEVLPRIPGYSPRRYDEPFFIDVVPKSRVVDGERITDRRELESAHRRTVMTARTRKEALRAVEEMKSRPEYEHYDVVARNTREFQLGEVVSQYQIHNELFRHAMKRGDHLPNVDGTKARLEDRLATLVRAVRSVNQNNAFRAWEDSLQREFMKQYADFLPTGKFPTFVTDIKPLPNMDEATFAQFQNARRIFEHFAKIKEIGTAGDHVWKTSLNQIADILENWKIPAGVLRDLAKTRNPAEYLPKVAAHTAWIAMSAPLRQWMIQPTQLFELWAIAPHKAIDSFQNTSKVVLLLASTSPTLRRSNFEVMARYLCDKLPGSLKGKELDDTMDAIRKSGLIQGVDMNLLVHGVFNDLGGKLDNSPVDKTLNIAGKAATALPKAFKAVGFTPAELFNRVGMWLQVKEMFKQKFPDRRWDAKDSLEYISHHSWKLSGNMSTAGGLPYQRGMLSPIFQFAAISQKNLMNLIQDNATILNKSQRVRLAAVRTAAYGLKRGLPLGLGYLVYELADWSGNEEDKKILQSPAFTRGFADTITNALVTAIFHPEQKPDLTVGQSLAPYGEYGHPFIEVAIETAKLFDDSPQTSPRYPVISISTSLKEAIEYAVMWNQTKEVNDTNFARAVFETAEIASSFSYLSQAMIIQATGDKVTKMGNKLGLQMTREEGIAKMLFGLGTTSEEILWKAQSEFYSLDRRLESIATDVHKQMIRMEKNGDPVEVGRGLERISFMMQLLEDGGELTPEERVKVTEKVLAMQVKRYRETQNSLLINLMKNKILSNSEEYRKTIELLRQSNDPGTKKILEMLDEGDL